ncbi:MAG TPA: cyclase family protein [Candidatus Binataceae bacterium]|jgi:kynurenine formamidase
MGTKLDAAEVKALFDRLSNWGRWGKDDQRGALNFITEQKRVAASRLVQAGQAISLALPLPTTPAIDNPNPVTHLTFQMGTEARATYHQSMDYFAISPHGMATTHLDALCHVFWRNKMYNGFDAGEVRADGAHRCGVDVMRDGVLSRGVLLDIPAVRGVRWLEPGDAIFPEELEAAQKLHRVETGEGDVLFVRTGRTLRRKTEGAWDIMRLGMAGLDASCLPWLFERGIALLGSDGISDVAPSGYKETPFPIHAVTIVAMGVHLIDNADLEALAQACASHGRYEFLFVLAPLVLERGTSSPVNPLAVF